MERSPPNSYFYLLFTVFGSTGRMIIGFPFTFYTQSFIDRIFRCAIFLFISIIIKYENPFKVFYDFCVVNVFGPPSPFQNPCQITMKSNWNSLIRLKRTVFAVLSVCWFDQGFVLCSLITNECMCDVREYCLDVWVLCVFRILCMNAT